MNVVTVSREYGSGGKDLGRYLADELGYRYLDKGIARELADRLHMNENYIDHFLDTGIPMGMSMGIDGSVAYSPEETQNNINLQMESQKLLREYADRENIVVIGRAADVILHDYKPFRIFVYATAASKLERFKSSEEFKGQTDSEIERVLHMVDMERYQHHALFSHLKWGDKGAYDLCINSGNIDLKKAAPHLADYIRIYFGD